MHEADCRCLVGLGANKLDLFQSQTAQGRSEKMAVDMWFFDQLSDIEPIEGEKKIGSDPGMIAHD